MKNRLLQHHGYNQKLTHNCLFPDLALSKTEYLSLIINHQVPNTGNPTDDKLPTECNGSDGKDFLSENWNGFCSSFCPHKTSENGFIDK